MCIRDRYGFDYLRDQMYLRDNRQSALGTVTLNRIRGLDPFKKLIQPANHHVALIDEADSVMIDEAMTPLVISLPAKGFEDPAPYLIAQKIVSKYVEGVEYTIEFPSKKIEVTEDAQQLAHDEIARKRNLQLSRPWRIYITNAIRASRTFQRNVDYVVVDGEVQIVARTQAASWPIGLGRTDFTKPSKPKRTCRFSQVANRQLKSHANDTCRCTTNWRG